MNPQLKLSARQQGLAKEVANLLLCAKTQKNTEALVAFAEQLEQLQVRENLDLYLKNFCCELPSLCDGSNLFIQHAKRVVGLLQTEDDIFRIFVPLVKRRSAALLERFQRFQKIEEREGGDDALLAVSAKSPEQKTCILSPQGKRSTPRVSAMSQAAQKQREEEEKRREELRRKNDDARYERLYSPFRRRAEAKLETVRLEQQLSASISGVQSPQMMSQHLDAPKTPVSQQARRTKPAKPRMQIGSQEELNPLGLNTRVEQYLSQKHAEEDLTRQIDDYYQQEHLKNRRKVTAEQEQIQIESQVMALRQDSVLGKIAQWESQLTRSKADDMQRSAQERERQIDQYQMLQRAKMPSASSYGISRVQPLELQAVYYPQQMSEFEQHYGIERMQAVRNTYRQTVDRYNNSLSTLQRLAQERRRFAEMRQLIIFYQNKVALMRKLKEVREHLRARLFSRW